MYLWMHRVHLCCLTRASAASTNLIRWATNRYVLACRSWVQNLALYYLTGIEPNYMLNATIDSVNAQHSIVKQYQLDKLVGLLLKYHFFTALFT
jgi:hypothetical protein